MVKASPAKISFSNVSTDLNHLAEALSQRAMGDPNFAL
jgi:hypothetical protein